MYTIFPKNIRSPENKFWAAFAPAGTLLLHVELLSNHNKHTLIQTIFLTNKIKLYAESKDNEFPDYAPDAFQLWKG